MTVDDRPHAQEHMLTAALAEYQQLKTEQQQRITVRDQLVGATILAAFAVAGAAQLAGPYITLILPPVCFALGWTYLATDQMIRNLGTYIREQLGPKVDFITGAYDSFGWESTNAARPNRATRRRMSYTADMLVFVAPAVACVLAGLYTVMAADMPTNLRVLGFAVVLGEALLAGVLASQFTCHAFPRPGLRPL
jgi:hypothetical protein